MPAARVHVSLDALKDALKQSIDDAAETERLRHITPGHGQSMTYMQKSDEARRYLAADAGDYPLLSAEVGITAPDIGGVATVVLEAYSQWQQIGAIIEAVRLGSKAAVASSESQPAAKAVFDAIAWPSGAP